MTKEERLISLLQPKDYKSKIKLYCRDCKPPTNLIEVFIPKIEDNRLKQIEIREVKV